MNKRQQCVDSSGYSMSNSDPSPRGVMATLPISSARPPIYFPHEPSHSVWPQALVVACIEATSRHINATPDAAAAGRAAFGRGDAFEQPSAARQGCVVLLGLLHSTACHVHRLLRSVLRHDLVVASREKAQHRRLHHSPSVNGFKLRQLLGGITVAGRIQWMPVNITVCTHKMEVGGCDTTTKGLRAVDWAAVRATLLPLPPGSDTPQQYPMLWGQTSMSAPDVHCPIDKATVGCTVAQQVPCPDRRIP